MVIAVTAATFAPLLLLACPVGMGLCMWMMARGMKGDGKAGDKDDVSEVERLRAEQRRLTEQVSRLENERSVERSSEHEPVAPK